MFVSVTGVQTGALPIWSESYTSGSAACMCGMCRHPRHSTLRGFLRGRKARLGMTTVDTAKRNSLT